MRRGGIPFERLQIEITESDLITHREDAAEALRGIRALGAWVALDDFGTGYSSLAELSELPVNALKLDHNFPAGETVRPSGMAVPLIALAHQLGLVVIAERIETERQRDALIELGVDELQGFLFGRPMPVDELATWLTNAPPAI